MMVACFEIPPRTYPSLPGVQLSGSWLPDRQYVSSGWRDSSEMEKVLVAEFGVDPFEKSKINLTMTGIETLQHLNWITIKYVVFDSSKGNYRPFQTLMLGLFSSVTCFPFPLE